MEIKLSGLVLKSVDIGESDKLITMLTDAKGKINIKARGVRKAKSKLKFAAQPFAFLECVVAQKNDYYTLIIASNISTFFELLQDYDKLQAGYLVLEIAEKISLYHKPTYVLADTLRALESISYSHNLQIPTVNFLKQVLQKNGYNIQFDNCIECGREIVEKEIMAFDLRGGVKCEKCFTDRDKSIKLQTYTLAKNIFLGGVYLQDCNYSHVISLLIKIIEENFSCKINSR